MTAISRGARVPLDGFDGGVELVTSTTVVCAGTLQSGAEHLGGSFRFAISAADDAVRAPFLVLVGSMRDAAMRPGAPVTIRQGVLSCGTSRWRIGDLPVWQPQRVALGQIALSRLSDAVDASLAVERSRDEIGAPLRRVSMALAEADQDGLDDAVRSVIGLGPGLTPAGDDALVGMLAVLGCRDERNDERGGHHLRSRLAAAVASQLHRTSALSAQLLSAAEAGDVNEAIDGVLVTAEHRPADLPDAIARLVRHGATSGVDALFGMGEASRLTRTLETAALAGVR